MAKGSVVLFVLLLAMAGARAAPASSVYLEDLTWPELRAEIQSGKTTILVPIGGTEQNGPQMALGKHNVRAHVLAGKIARALGFAIELAALEAEAEAEDDV